MAHPKPQRPQAAQGTFHQSPISTTAAFPEIHCRCGMAYTKPQHPQAAQRTFHPSPTSTTAAFPAICCRCGTAHPKPQRPQAAQRTFHPSPTSTTAPFPEIRCRCGMAHPKPQRPQAAQRTFHPSPTSTTAAFPAICCRCGTTTCKQFTTNGKYCSGHYLQNIDNQPYHNITRVFRPYPNIRKTLVIFPTTSKSRTYQNTPLLHLPLDPPPPGLNHLPKVGDILSCINGSELWETIALQLTEHDITAPPSRPQPDGSRPPSSERYRQPRAGRR